MIYNKDCIIVMNDIMDYESVDVIVTSPPYNAGIDYGDYNDKQLMIDYEVFTKNWVAECFRITKPGGRFCININNTLKDWQINKIISFTAFITQIAEKCGWEFREHITWIKMKEEGDIYAGGKTAWGSWLSASNPQLRSFTEPILVFHKQSAKKEPVGESDLTKEEFLEWTKNAWYVMPSNHEIHPAVFPPEIPRRLIKLYSYVGDTIFDPFMGSGTTLLVAKKLKRNYIGCEINKRFFNIAKVNLEQQDLFI